MYRTLLAAVTVLAVTVPTFATVTVDVGVTTSGGSVANALNVNMTGRWIGTDLLVTLTQGSVINLSPDLGGVNGAPTQAQIDANPALLFDTWLGRIGPVTGSEEFGGAVELGAADVGTLGPTGISAEWYGDVVSGYLTIGNFVFSDDAEGVWSLAMFESGQKQANFIGGSLSNGVLLTDFLPGDLDDNDFVGLDDLDIVLDQWNTDGSGDPRSDPTGDGYVGLDDLDLVLRDWNADMTQGPWSYIPTGRPGDLNGDDFVALDDLDIVLNSWHLNVPPGDMADPSGDGFVGLDDINVVLTYWHTGTPLSVDVSVPEPASLTLLLAGGLVLCKRKV